MIDTHEYTYSELFLMELDVINKWDDNKRLMACAFSDSLIASRGWKHPPEISKTTKGMTISLQYRWIYIVYSLVFNCREGVY